ncbi:MAG: TonB C-terminal domain-containing protein, partial [Cyanobacteria bacterium SZAS LIN-2]|nr:TonB C-terminal domain-containing protein [Cyanobacteria bacterium SZAS LIN-2]
PGTMPGGGPGSTLTPVVLGAGPSTGRGHTGQGANNNPGEGARPGENIDSTPDVNWMPYMADLQRRIKRNWYPPKALETKRVKVIFTLSTDGTLSNLRMVRSSGLQLADIAALKAVENAAPFRPLPPHAPASVDIEFTFDYNIFSGGGLR